MEEGKESCTKTHNDEVSNVEYFHAEIKGVGEYVFNSTFLLKLAFRVLHLYMIFEGKEDGSDKSWKGDGPMRPPSHCTRPLIERPCAGRGEAI